ncbi:MAG TPA: D-alanine--D-alanine ligase [Nitrospiraceae bacterium]|nr:D-alanine--D-alanine ligase [Nitrospiraceae bacterium]
MPLTTARVGVLMGGQSAERDVSLRTGQAVHQALVRRGYDTVAIDVGPNIARDLHELKVGLAFIALHGPGGEDGTIQGLLESLGIPYTGSGVRASAVAMHKVLTKVVLASQGIPVPPGGVIVKERAKGKRPPLPRGLKWPVVVKPATQGSTIGVSIVRKPAGWMEALELAHRYDNEAVVEAFIPGHEITVGVLRSGSTLQALPAVEIAAPEGFYDFSAKYQKGQTRYLCPAPLSGKVARLLRDLARRSYEAIGCEGAARVDFRVTPKGKPSVLEVNTVPGMTETSLLPMAAAQAGIDYDGLTERILESALARIKRA